MSVAVLTTCVIALVAAVGYESTILWLQFKLGLLSRLFGKYAFRFQLATSGMLWLIALGTYLCWQSILICKGYPARTPYLSCPGLLMVLAGTALCGKAVSLLGLRRVLCVNFFVNTQAPPIANSVYAFFSHPLHLGMMLTYAGFAVITPTLSNICVALLFLILIIPHGLIESLPLEMKRTSESRVSPLTETLLS